MVGCVFPSFLVRLIAVNPTMPEKGARGQPLPLPFSKGAEGARSALLRSINSSTLIFTGNLILTHKVNPKNYCMNETTPFYDFAHRAPIAEF